MVGAGAVVSAVVSEVPAVDASEAEVSDTADVVTVTAAEVSAVVAAVSVVVAVEVSAVVVFAVVRFAVAEVAVVSGTIVMYSDVVSGSFGVVVVETEVSDDEVTVAAGSVSGILSPDKSSIRAVTRAAPATPAAPNRSLIYKGS